jgi:protein-tyrosine phosphatase
VFALNPRGLPPPAEHHHVASCGEEGMIDFHNHVIPGVDDGAEDAAESRSALVAFGEQGVRAVVATPHVEGSLTADPVRLAARMAELDRGWTLLQGAAAEVGTVEVFRGAEVMLDQPELDLSDARLRLAGTGFVLIEFPFMAVPPNAEQSLFSIRMQGYKPILAHPERYANAASDPKDAEGWVRVGAHLQVNAGSLLGRYGPRAQTLAWRLVRGGIAAYVASDHHARGTLHLRAARAELERRGGAEQADLLMNVNPERLLAGDDPLPVPPFEGRRPPLWRRLLGRGR